MLKSKADSLVETVETFLKMDDNLGQPLMTQEEAWDLVLFVPELEAPVWGSVCLGMSTKLPEARFAVVPLNLPPGQTVVSCRTLVARK